MRRITSPRLAYTGLITAIAGAAALVACGGDGSDSAPPAAPAPPPAATLTLTGTAASGQALAGATVDAKCSGGTGSATTAADGGYSLAINGGVLPCALRVTAGGTVLHSVATGSGATAQANLTPLTDLVVAALAVDTPSGYFAAFGSGAAASLDIGAAQAAVSAVADLLKGSADISALGNVLTAALVPAVGGSAGDAHDQALVALQSALVANGMTLADLEAALLRSAPTPPQAAPVTTAASLPPDRLLAPRAPNCAALRNGKYRILINEDGGSSPSTEVVTVDAPALTVTNSANEVAQLTAAGDCKYALPSGGEAAVSKAGVAVGRVDGARPSPPLKGAVLFPEQSHGVAELAGAWNMIAFDRTTDNGPIHLTSGTFTFDAGGRLTGLDFCDDVRTCESVPSAEIPAATLVPNSAGGFDFVNTTDNFTDRLFAYRAGGGELMLVMLSYSGHIMFATRKAPLTMPVLGRIQETWNLTLNPNYTAPAVLSASRNTVVSEDAAAASYVRTSITNFSTGATRPETLRLNDFRQGYARREAATGVVQSDGSLGNVSEWLSLPLRGMDMSVLALLQSNQLLLATVSSTTLP